MSGYHYLTLNDCLDIHYDVIMRYGGAREHHDIGLLESAISQPQQNIFGEEVYKTVFEKAAAYIFFIIKNHAFKDGNKRTGLVSALVFLERHDIAINGNFESLYNFAINVAASKIEFSEIVEYLKKNAIINE